MISKRFKAVGTFVGVLFLLGLLAVGALAALILLA